MKKKLILLYFLNNFTGKLLYPKLQQINSWFLIKDRELASKICLNFCPRSNGNLIMILLVKSIEGRIFVNVI
jgi:hypothetical protein